MSDEQVTQSENQSTDSPSTDAPAKTRQMSFEVLESGEIRADFGKGLEPLLLNPALVPEHIIAAAVTEGLISRTRGYTSKLSADDRTPEALRAAVEKGFAALLAGTWKIERVAGGSADYPLEVEAAHRFRKMRAESKGEEFTSTIEEAAVNFAALTDDQKKTLKALPRYQLALAEVKAERQAEKAAAMAKKIAESGEDEAGF